MPKIMSSSAAQTRQYIGFLDQIERGQPNAGHLYKNKRTGTYAVISNRQRNFSHLSFSRLSLREIACYIFDHQNELQENQILAAINHLTRMKKRKIEKKKAMNFLERMVRSIFERFQNLYYCGKFSSTTTITTKVISSLRSLISEEKIYDAQKVPNLPIKKNPQPTQQVITTPTNQQSVRNLWEQRSSARFQEVEKHELSGKREGGDPKKEALKAYCSNPIGCSDKHKSLLFLNINYLKKDIGIREGTANYLQYINQKEKTADHASAIWLIYAVSQTDKIDLNNIKTQQIIIDLLGYCKREIRDRVINWLKLMKVPSSLSIQILKLLTLRVQESNNLELYLYAFEVTLKLYQETQNLNCKKDQRVIEAAVTAFLKARSENNTIGDFIQWWIAQNCYSAQAIKNWIEIFRLKNLDRPLVAQMRNAL